MAEILAAKMYGLRGLPPFEYVDSDGFLRLTMRNRPVQVVFDPDDAVNLRSDPGLDLIVVYVRTDGLVAEIYNGPASGLWRERRFILAGDIPGFETVDSRRGEPTRDWQGEGIRPLSPDQIHEVFSLDVSDVMGEDEPPPRSWDRGSAEDDSDDEPPQGRDGDDDGGGGGGGGGGDGGDGDGPDGPRRGGAGVRELLEHQILFSVDKDIYNDILDQA
ncbi:MAG: hypothetical protein DI523_20220 [Paraburkholderia fungorum]|nr:MAG: hypothetical protein DI523_20220 [Paraburkholderia fungorum]